MEKTSNINSSSVYIKNTANRTMAQDFFRAVGKMIKPIVWALVLSSSKGVNGVLTSEDQKRSSQVDIMQDYIGNVSTDHNCRNELNDYMNKDCNDINNDGMPNNPFCNQKEYSLAKSLIEKFCEDNANLDNTLSSYGGKIKDEIDTLEKDNTALAKNNTALANNNTALANNNTALAKNNTALAKNNTALADNKTTLEKDKTALAKNNTALADNNTALANNNTELADTNKDLTGNLTQIANELNVNADGLDGSTSNARLLQEVGLNPSFLPQMSQITDEDVTTASNVVHRLLSTGSSIEDIANNIISAINSVKGERDSATGDVKKKDNIIIAESIFMGLSISAGILILSYLKRTINTKTKEITKKTDAEKKAIESKITAIVNNLTTLDIVVTYSNNKFEFKKKDNHSQRDVSNCPKTRKGLKQLRQEIKDAAAIAPINKVQDVTPTLDALYDQINRNSQQTDNKITKDQLNNWVLSFTSDEVSIPVNDNDSNLSSKESSIELPVQKVPTLKPRG
jgi:DNA repair exonuclease SbcCD ATPase subunit